MKHVYILLAGLIMISPLIADISDKIEANKVKINQKKSQEKKLSHQLDQIAKDIAKQKSAVRVIIKKIDKCKAKIQQLKKKSQIKGSELQKIADAADRLVDDAQTITMDIHQDGQGTAGIFKFDIAETKAVQVMDIARDKGYPLMAQIMEID